MTQIIKRPGEGIAATDGAGRSEEGACDLHRQIWIKKNARKKMLSEVAQPCQRSPNLPILVAQPTYSGRQT